MTQKEKKQMEYKSVKYLKTSQKTVLAQQMIDT